MITYIIVSYVFMLLCLVVEFVRDGEATAFKMFLLAPFWFPIVVAGMVLSLINWSLK